MIQDNGPQDLEVKHIDYFHNRDQLEDINYIVIILYIQIPQLTPLYVH